MLYYNKYLNRKERREGGGRERARARTSNKEKEGKEKERKKKDIEGKQSFFKTGLP